AADIDIIIVATTTPDRTFPATAAILQNKLGTGHGFALDVQAVCSGFVFALATADGYLRNRMGKRALAVGADTPARIPDWPDSAHGVRCGAGASAVVLEAQYEAGVPDEPRGMLVSSLRTDCSQWDMLYTDGGVSVNRQAGLVRMEGREVFRHAVG